MNNIDKPDNENSDRTEPQDDSKKRRRPLGDGSNDDQSDESTEGKPDRPNETRPLGGGGRTERPG